MADKISVACPKCGHAQKEPATAYSTVCKQCGQYFRVQEQPDDGHPVPSVPRGQPKPIKDARHVSCFKCGTDLEVPSTAQSTMCKRCSSHVDLRDYQIKNTVSKNFRTKGRFVIEEGGFLLNTELTGGEVVIRGKVIGKLVAEQSLEIYDTGEIKGTFKAARLIIPAHNHFRWKEPIHVETAEITGELVADVVAQGSVHIHASGIFFGNLVAGSLTVDEGAVVVGDTRIGKAFEPKLSVVEGTATAHPVEHNHPPPAIKRIK